MPHYLTCCRESILSRFPDWPPNWLLSRLSPTLREHAFEPARLDAVADYMTRRGRCRSGITRWMCAVLLRFQIIVLVVQCLRLQSETTHVSRAWRSDAMRYLLRDLRHAARALVRRPGYALVAVINDVAAARFFPGEDPVGGAFRLRVSPIRTLSSA
jgi:hypothetical protein